jgi:cytochrome b6-f complex iron-sulfur subunit
MMNHQPKTRFITVSEDRRNFLQAGLKVLGVLAVVEVGAAGLLFLRARSLEGKFGGVITVGKVDEFKPGTVVEFDDGNFYLVCTNDGGFMAIYRRCPHLGCTVNWVPQKEKFFCPCHAASFDQYGEYESQVVSRAMDTFQVNFEDGLVKVDTSQVQTRQHHNPENIKYPQRAPGGGGDAG